MAIFVRSLLLILVTCLVAGCGADVSDGEYVDNARNYVLEGNNKAAIIELKNALKKNSDNQSARLLLGEVYFNLGTYADADKELRKAAELGAPGSEVLPLLAQTLLARNELKDLQAISIDQLSPDARATVLAAQAFGKLRQGEADAAALLSDQSLQESPNAVYPRFVRAWTLVARSAGEFAEVRKQLEAVFQVDPDYGPALALLGDIELQSEQLAAADSAYSRAIAARDNNFDDHYKRALLRFQMKNVDGAREDLKALQAQMPQHPGTHYLRGILNYHDGNLSDAATEFQSASQFEDQYPLALYYLAVVNMKLGNLAQAEASAARYLAPEPDNVAGRKLLAMIKLQSGANAEVEQLIRPVVEANGEDVDALNLLATALLKQGKTEEGVDLVARVAQLRPDSADAQSRLGAVLMGSGEVAGGMQHFETAMAIDPQLQRTDVLLISALMQQQNYDAALDAIDSFEKKNPGEIAAPTMRGSVYLKAGKIAEAEQAFAAVLEVSPGDPGANHNLALLAIQSKDYPRARAYYQNVLEYDKDNLATLLNLAALSQLEQDKPAMVAFLERAVEAHPAEVRPRVVLARHYLVEGQADKVALVLAGLEETGRTDPDVINAEGLAQLTSGQYHDAKVSFERLIELRPDAPQPHYHLGLVYRGLGDNSRMTAEFKQAVQISPDYLEPRIELARALLQARDRDAAVEQLEILRRIVPGNAEVIQLEAVRARFDNDQAEALRLSQSAFEKAPTSRNLLVLSRQHWEMGDREATLRLMASWVEAHPTDVTVRLEMASLLESSGQQAQAITHYRAVLDQDSTNVLALNNLAWQLRDTDPAQGLAYAEQAAAIQPRSAPVLDTLAVLQLKNNEPENAKRSIEQALLQNAGDPGTRYHRAMILAAAGDPAAAIIALQELLAEGQEFPQKSEAQQLLEELQ